MNEDMDSLIREAGMNPSDFQLQNEQSEQEIPQSSTIQVVEERNTETATNNVDSIYSEVMDELGFPAYETIQETEVAETGTQAERVEGNQLAEEENLLPTENTFTEGQSIDNERGQEYFSIPYNSPSLLVHESTSRFSGTEWYEAVKHSTIIIAGLGGIGSWLAFNMARLHPANILLYDDDIVEVANMSGQLYSRNDFGQLKSAAMSSFLTKYTDTTNTFCISERFEENTQPGDVMLCGFDSMDSRKVFFNAWHNHVLNLPEERRKKCLFMDGRLSIDTLQILVFTGADDYYIHKYITEYLFSDEQADETVCSMKQTTYMACMIGALMTNLFVNFIANTLYEFPIYELPFFTEYNSQMMMLKVKKQ